MTSPYDYGVQCKTAAGEEILVTLAASDAADAIRQVQQHRALWYELGDTAGRWLASKNPNTIVEVGDARPLSEWSA